MARWRGADVPRSVRRAGKGRTRGADCIRQLALIAIVSVFAGAFSEAVLAFNHERVAEKFRRDFVLPRYTALSAELDTLATAVSALCAKPNQKSLDRTRQSFRKTVYAWGQVELISFGPIAEQNRYERIFFWPDRKGIGRRQVRRLLRSKDPSALIRERLAKKSVAVQGLTAMELLFYGKAADQVEDAKPNSYRCRYARTIVENLAAIITDVRRSWGDDGDFARQWHSPGPNNPVYLEARETTHEVVKAFGQSLEILRDRRIAPAIGMGPTRRAKRPVLWRSKLTLTLLRANVVAARDLLDEAGIERAYKDHHESPEKAASDFDSIKTDFRFLIENIDDLARDDDPFARDDIRRRLIAIGFPLKSIREHTVALLSIAADLSLGFNASDGD